MVRFIWPNFEEWKQYGIEAGYNERNPNSLKKGKNKVERSWYERGQREKWLRGFEFERLRLNNLFRNFEEWENYGLKNNYNKRNPNSLQTSKDKYERSWYKRGEREKWLKFFEFERKSEKSPWKNYKEWKKYGLENGYNDRNQDSLYKSENKLERSWYTKGSKKRWLKIFEFKRLIFNNLFRNFEEWENYGLKNNYNKRNPNSLQTSKDKYERSWYLKGGSKNWLQNFEFERKKGRWKDLKFTLKQAKELLKKHDIEYFPGGGILKKLEYYSLTTAINRYHNGFPAFREKLRKYLGQPSQENQLENLLQEYVGKGE